MYIIDYSITTAREVPNPLKRTKAKVKPLTSRLRKSKNFWKLDRSLDDYIDRTDLIKCGPKRLLRKLLFLRPSEDSNEVKVTANGLSKLMNVNVKTIRSWLKALEKAEFIYFQGNAWDKGCNYPKKKYIFPVTFPGFDLATVFIQKGAKAKYKKRMADPVKAKAKLNKMARLARKNTCPVVSALVDCPSFKERETQNSKEDTKVSSPLEILPEKTQSAAPSAFSRETFFKRPIPVLDYAPELKELLVTILAQNKCKGKIRYVSNFLEWCVNNNGTFEAPFDRQELAVDLHYVIPEALQYFGRNLLKDLLKFIYGYIAYYRASSSKLTVEKRDQYNRWAMQLSHIYHERKSDLMRKFPFLDPIDPRFRTGFNQSP